MRIVFLSDAHIFQTFRETYNPMPDFERVMKDAKNKQPEIIVFAGDFFDFKKTRTTYLRHYEGESMMVTIRKILKNRTYTTTNSFKTWNKVVYYNHGHKILR